MLFLIFQRRNQNEYRGITWIRQNSITRKGAKNQDVQEIWKSDEELKRRGMITVHIYTQRYVYAQKHRRIHNSIYIYIEVRAFVCESGGMDHICNSELTQV